MGSDPVASAFAMGGPGAAAIAAGSVATARAGAEALRAGGNAVDAVVAAAFASTVAEQAVTSLGGGGFLLVRTPQGAVHVRDFFVDTPGRGLPVQELDLHFLPMQVQFPGSVQTFHAGMGSVAVPGTLSGVLQAQQEFCRLPLRDLVAPARRYAAEGVPLEPMQQVIGSLSRELLTLSPGSRALFERDGRWLLAGDLIANHDLAVFLDRIADGDVTSVESTPFAAPLLDAMDPGGLVTAADLEAYRVVAREPATAQRAGYEIFTNPPPSFGGSIIADTLTHAGPMDVGDPDSWVGLLSTLAAATKHRRAGLTTPLSATGTTHCSAVDPQGMVATMTTSNGITSGFVVPGTGIQLNNMLGESDLNPDGFHATPPGQRLGSMMSPSVIVAPDGGLVGLGTGGSERIRSSLVEVMVRIIDGGESLLSAISAARVHPDAQGLQVEPHLPDRVIEGLRASGLAPVNVWREPSLFFGGVNAVQRRADGRVLAVSDGRRGGGAIVLD
ncbi:MAG: gamma-glutamyltransferase [Candidatus Nanopelagicales bacterium]